jgi:hypothetical protein
MDPLFIQRLSLGRGGGYCVFLFEMKFSEEFVFSTEATFAYRKCVQQLYYAVGMNKERHRSQAQKSSETVMKVQPLSDNGQ